MFPSHDQLALVFAHGGVEIDGKDYIAEEEYRYQIDETYPLSRGEIILTERTYQFENILS